MSEWKKYRVCELCSEIIDCVNKTAPISAKETPFKMLRTSDVKEGFINLEGLNCVTEEVFQKWTRRGELRFGDVIFTREAPLGEVGIVREAKNYFMGQRLVLYRANPNMCDSRFLMYWFLNPVNKEGLKSRGVGSTVTHLRVPECENIEIIAPKVETQRRIADILSAYDDLIENNQKQIKLLEEAAQRLYKEWFVNLRFPGHENVKIIDGVPEGWRKGLLSEIVPFQRGKTISSKQVKKGKVPVVAGGLEPAYYHDKANTKAPVITVSGSGANAGFCKLYNEDVFASDCSFADINGTKSIFFVYCFLKANKCQLDVLQRGSAQPHVYAKDINAMKICIPNISVIDRFCEIVSFHYEKISMLEKQCAVAIEARDRLLPKLMSGEIEL